MVARRDRPSSIKASREDLSRLQPPLYMAEKVAAVLGSSSLLFGGLPVQSELSSPGFFSSITASGKPLTNRIKSGRLLWWFSITVN